MIASAQRLFHTIYSSTTGMISPTQPVLSKSTVDASVRNSSRFCSAEACLAILGTEMRRPSNGHIRVHERSTLIWNGREIIMPFWSDRSDLLFKTLKLCFESGPFGIWA